MLLVREMYTTFLYFNQPACSSEVHPCLLGYFPSSRRLSSTSVVFSEDLHDALESKPLWDVLTSSEHLPELGSRQLLDVQALVAGDAGGHVSFLLGVDDVQAWHGLDSKLLGHLLRQVLGVVGAVEVLSVQAGLASGHVSSDDEVGASVVLPDDHVLDRLPRTRHVHAVRQVGPVDLWVGGLLLEHLVGSVPHHARDVVVLGWSAGRVDEDNAVASDVVGVESSREELVVSLVDRVPALEGHNVDVGWEHLPDLGWGLAGEDSRRLLEPVDLSSQVDAAPLHGDRLNTRVLEGAGAVALLRLERLVWLVGRRDLHDREVLALVGQQDVHSRGEGLVGGVHDNGQAEEQARRHSHGLHDGLVLLLVHESGERGEPSDGQELDVAGVPVAALDGPSLPM